MGEYRRYRDALDDDAGADWGRSKAALETVRRARSGREAALRAALEEAISVAAVAAAAPSNAEPAVHDLADGTLALTLYRGETGFVAFASTARGTHAIDLGNLRTDAPDAELADSLVRPLQRFLEPATLIRLYTDASLWSRDLHALPFAGAPLVAHAAVEYVVGSHAPRAATSVLPHGVARSARVLVVGDPLGDLPRARMEAESVFKALAGATGTAPQLLLGPAATRLAVASALAAADFVHYAGHGAFAGREGWESTLPLAGGAHLSIADILSLRSAPRAVVLSACESAGTTDDRSGSSGVGLAHAFLAAGADLVIAAVRPIDDDTAARIVNDLYANFDDPTALANALRRSELSVRALRPDADWSALRVLRR